jgi:hypothetical protein
MKRTETNEKRWIRLWPIFLLMVTGLIVRFYIFLNITPRLHTDSVTYLILSDLEMVRTPGYPILIEILQFINDLFAFTTDYLGLIVFFQLFILGLTNVILVYILAKKMTKSTLFALFVGLLYNTNYFLLGFEFQILTETFATTLLLLTLLFYVKMVGGEKKYIWLAGFFSTWLILTRPVFLLLFIGLVIITLVVHISQIRKQHFLKKIAGSLIIFMVFNIVGITSWSLRNKIKYDYFGISILMPYQLRHYTKHFFHMYKKDDNADLNQYADIFLEEGCNAGRFDERLQKEFGFNQVEISSIFMKLNLKIIKDNPGEYLKQLPDSAADYYKNYSNFWMVPYNKIFLKNKGFIPRIFLFFYKLNVKLYKNLIPMLLMVVLLPALLLFFIRKDKKIFHLALLIEGVIQYNFLISVIATNSGIDNLRYRVPVEPLIILMFFTSLFYLGKKGFEFIGKRTLL